ncbi:SIMPL domain-containing protein [Pseudoalteromonas sp. SWN166]|uniref:SIMPL domain-containing protein n=1 Tax=Pseudoalteromonas sp. SWN166 TaxID=2792061 RepID=UPI0018CD615E|nr:SIMPL domain-containing protein [Pseudoalteromonas sp. SWN166]MBH0040048.1 SIMPL domain-containing protein [Pseudoalteromonas sp. SWN166]
MKLITTIFLTLFPLITFANSSLPDNRHIAVQGTAEVLVEPDMAQVSFEVTSTKDTLLEAKRDIDAQINSLLEGVDKYGFEQDDVFVSGLKSNVYNIIGTEAGTVSGDKYLALKTVKVTINDIKKIDGFIEFAQSVKINNVIAIESVSSKAKLLEAQVTQAAVDDAIAKGNLLAKAFGTKLGKVYSISSNSNRTNYSDNEGDAKHSVLSGYTNNSNPFEHKRYVDKTISTNSIISITSSINVMFDLEVND